MSKLKNPAIKLFGKTISVRPDHAEAHHHHERQASSSAFIEKKSRPEEDFMGSRLEADPINPTVDEPVELDMPSTASETLETPVASGNTLSPKDTIREDQTENSDIENMMKKPEKILPCPRCSSMETKFCYYNNYNVKQPRHFCKSCQRFWTVGGTMRNVAVGSGRRKNKGSSTPDHAKSTEGFTSPQGYGPQISCFSGSPWSSNWNAVHFSSPASQDATFPSSFAVNLYPANSYYISAAPGPWGPPPFLSPNLSMASTNPTSPLGKHCSDNSLLQLNFDKGCSAVESGAQSYIRPNKALKIDDVNDAATRCIRSPMGIKDSNEYSFTGSSHFKSFYPIVDGKHHIVDNSLILQANPAAFSRSMNFHERF